MLVLIVKTSSLGDVIHTLPAVSDAVAAIPEIQFDWVVEDSFAEIPQWHPQVRQVIPVKIRTWRRNWLKSWVSGEIPSALKQLRAQSYDYIIDAQGLFKSATISLLARGRRYGLDKYSSRGPLATYLYQHRYQIPWDQHAVERVRQLFAEILGYSRPTQLPNYGVGDSFPVRAEQQNYLICFANTTWETKFWPVAYWQRLISIALAAGYQVKLFANNELEKAYVTLLSQKSEGVDIIYQKTISEVAQLIIGSKGVITVDTGLGHLAAALGVSTISLQGPTAAKRSGAYGPQVYPLEVDFPCAPCFQRKCTHPNFHNIGSPPCYQTLAPEKVWETLQQAQHLSE